MPSLVWLFLATVVGLGCSTGSPAAPTNDVPAIAIPTYHHDVAPFLERRCVNCHRPGGLGPFSLTTFAEASAMAPAMLAEVRAKRMPPWGAHDSEECAPSLLWQGDERLTDVEILMLDRWWGAGTPEGDQRTAISWAPTLEPARLVAPTLELIPRAPFVPTTGVSQDQFECFVLDAPELSAGGYVAAIDVVPSNRQIVHHVSVLSDLNGALASRAGADGHWSCAPGSLGQQAPGAAKPSYAWLLAWAPGARPLRLPPDLGIHVPAGAKIIMEVHYSINGSSFAPDQTRIDVEMTPTRPSFTLSSWAVGNAGPLPNGDGLQPGPADRDGVIEFRIPAQATNHVETFRTTFPLAGPFPIFGLRPHAHLAAVDIKVDLKHAGSEQCLVQDRWDFHWQRSYLYDAPIEALPSFRAGDTLTVRCTYNNSMSNRRLASERAQQGLPPSDMFFGDSSLNEMCLVELLYVTETPPQQL